MSTSGERRTVDDVAVDITLECVDPSGGVHQIDTVLGYHRSDPYAVTMTFLTSTGDLTWTFGRDLLQRGVVRPTGEGDVRVAPSIGGTGRAIVLVELSSPDGCLVLQASSDEITDFLDRSLALVPPGTESDHLDLDALLVQLLGS